MTVYFGFADPFWCKQCEEFRVHSAGALCPVCDPTPPRPIPRPRLANDPHPAPIATSSTEEAAC